MSSINRIFVAASFLFLLCSHLIIPAQASTTEEQAEIAPLLAKLRIIQPKETVLEDIVLPDLNGRFVSILKQPGQIVMVTFWASWCPDCRREMPAMERLHKRFKERGLRIMAVNLMEPATVVRNFGEEMGVSFPLLLDLQGEMARRFTLHSIPTTYLLNKNGRVIGRADGARDWDSNEAQHLFEILLPEASHALPPQKKQ